MAIQYVKNEKKQSTNAVSIKITLIYFVFGVVWIFTTDKIIELDFANNLTQISFWQNAKGVFFVALSSVIIYFSVRFFTNKLKNKEADYLNLFSHHPSPMLICDTNTHSILEVNQLAVKLYGYTKSEFLKKSMLDFCELYQVKNICAPNNLKPKLCKHTTATGNTIYVELSAFSINYKGKDSRLIVAHNITDYEEKRNKLRIENYELNYFRYALEQSNLLVITNKNGEIEFINDIFAQVTGFSKEELLGKNVNVLKSENQDQSVFENLWKTITQGEVWKGEIKNIDKQGQEFWIDMQVVPLKNESGKTVKFMSISRDITRRKMAEFELKNNTQKLKAIAWANSHTIRKPLSSILGIAELIKLNNGQIDKKTLLYLNMASNELDNVLRDINSKL
ncbi:MAG: PAS domain S-box protein [Bacteroidia bacterium]